MNARFRTLAAVSLVLVARAPLAFAEEIHLDCGARSKHAVAVDVDIGRRFVQLVWEEGVAEEYQDGYSYLSGDTQKVTFVVSVEKDAVRFGQDRVCAAGATGKCHDARIRNILDVAASVLKYDDGGVVVAMPCAAAPPGRRF